MECSRGSMCIDSTHEVTTFKKAFEWYSLVSLWDLPITVHQQKASNGRRLVKVYNNHGDLLEQRG